jgi:hypothetical protein
MVVGMRRSRSPISLALPQFFENEEIGRAWMRAPEQETPAACSSPEHLFDLAVLAETVRRAVGWFRRGLPTSARRRRDVM